MAIYAYARLGGGWGWGALLLLAPDLSIAGYLISIRTGSVLYNIAHTYLIPGVLLALGWAWQQPTLTQAGLLIAAHIGIDRALGFGLKYPTTFGDTHIQHV